MPTRTAGALLALLILSTGCTSADKAPAASKHSNAPKPVQVEQVSYQGWENAWAIRNDACELIVVPSVSRVMSFRLTGGSNLLWQDPTLAGKTFAEDPKEWKNIGGEKLWPTQQDLFGRFTGLGRDWPPPWPWDAGASKAEAIENGVRLTLPHDPRFGAHAVREFVIDPAKPLVHVRQWIAKTDGDPVPMTLWTVMQVNNPQLSFLPSADGKYALMGPESQQIVAKPGHVSLGRDEKRGLKIGVAAQGQNGYVAALFAQAENRPHVLLVQSHKLVADGTYPDKGLQAQLYTSPVNFARYTELELLAPLVTLRGGERLQDDRVWQIVEVTDERDAPELAADAHARALQLMND
jgi:hypothetical protein